MLKLPAANSGLASGQSLVNIEIRYHNPQKLTYTPTLKVLSRSGSPPADPGQAGKSTLAGVDVNLNEIRDDVENYIATQFGKSQKLMHALNQYAIAMQKGITAQTDNNSMQAANLTSRALECQEFIAPNDESWKKVHSIAVNTPERMTAWRSHERRLSGNVFPSRPVREWKTSCTFNPDTFTN